MAKKSKSQRRPARCVAVIAANMCALMDERYWDEPNRTAKCARLAREADTVVNRVQRVVSGSVAVGVDMLERFAAALGVTAADLLTDKYVAIRGKRESSSSLTVAQTELARTLERVPPDLRESIKALIRAAAGPTPAPSVSQRSGEA